MNPHLTCTRHLGGTVTAGSRMSGTVYASHSQRKPHSSCWMELAVFDHFPEVPSLAGAHIQCRSDLKSSTPGAGEVRARIQLQFELFDDESPKTCANFLRLCGGQTTAKREEKYWHKEVQPTYRGTFFHKIIPDLCAQGGDLTLRVDGGANHYSSAGRGWFEDESKRRRHNEVGLLSMANNGPNSNGSQFFITTSSACEKVFNGRHCCFGRVVSGLDAFLAEVGPYGTVQGYPSRYVVVVDCGDGTAPPMKEDVEQKEEASTPAPAAVTPPTTATASSSAHACEEEIEEDVAEENHPAASAEVAPQPEVADVLVVDDSCPEEVGLKSAMKKSTEAQTGKHVSYQGM